MHDSSASKILSPSRIIRSLDVDVDAEKSMSAGGNAIQLLGDAQEPSRGRLSINHLSDSRRLIQEALCTVESYISELRENVESIRKEHQTGLEVIEKEHIGLYKQLESNKNNALLRDMLEDFKVGLKFHTFVSYMLTIFSGSNASIHGRKARLI